MYQLNCYCIQKCLLGSKTYDFLMNFAFVNKNTQNFPILYTVYLLIFCAISAYLQVSEIEVHCEYQMLTTL